MRHLLYLSTLLVTVMLTICCSSSSGEGKPDDKVFEIRSISEQNFTARGGECRIEAFSDGRAISAESEEDWVKPILVQGYNITFTVPEYIGEVDRSAVITLTCLGSKKELTVTIRQTKPEGTYFNVTDDPQSVDGQGGPVMITVTTNITYTVTVTEGDDWLTFVERNDTGALFDATANPSFENERIAKAVISPTEGEPVTVEFTQKRREINFETFLGQWSWESMGKFSAESNETKTVTFNILEDNLQYEVTGLDFPFAVTYNTATKSLQIGRCYGGTSDINPERPHIWLVLTYSTATNFNTNPINSYYLEAFPEVSDQSITAEFKKGSRMTTSSPYDGFSFRGFSSISSPSSSEGSVLSDDWFYFFNKLTKL